MTRLVATLAVPLFACGGSAGQELVSEPTPVATGAPTSNPPPAADAEGPPTLDGGGEAAEDVILSQEGGSEAAADVLLSQDGGGEAAAEDVSKDSGQGEASIPAKAAAPADAGQDAPAANCRLSSSGAWQCTAVLPDGGASPGHVILCTNPPPYPFTWYPPSTPQSGVLINGCDYTNCCW